MNPEGLMLPTPLTKPPTHHPSRYGQGKETKENGAELKEMNGMERMEDMGGMGRDSKGSMDVWVRI